MAICYALWRGIPEDAILGDKTSGIYADPAEIEKIDFDGEYLKCHATPSVLPSPKG